MISVYLDNSDYSVLSRKALAPELAQIKDTLLDMATVGDVRFVFSSVVVCEAAPTEPDAVKYAIERGDFLTQLCQRNALIHPAALIEYEIRALAERRPTPTNALSETQDWFPTVEFDDPTPLSEAVREYMNTDPEIQAMPRQQRREAKRKLFKKNGLRPEIQGAIRAAAGQAYVDSIVGRFPMERSQADVFRRYALNEATKEEATEAMKASLRDPCWLMRWFAENPGLAVPIADMVRKPGQEIGAALRSYVEMVDRLKATAGYGDDGQSLWKQLPASKQADWTNNSNRLLLGLVERFRMHCGVRFDQPATVKDVACSCHSLDATIRAIMSSVWDNIGGSRKELPSDSQFPDAMHAMYAPYVDVFRADSYMAQHIERQVKRHGTQVVAKLRELPGVITRLRENRPD
ncbi:MAG: hypothetical protein LBQ32_00750 [Burkholderiaceae bacterium]|jgi:hypothetical protein|nr:hypothetical protein [Burkholderiaceae bacterium]